jgi:hypothetical protein
VKASFSAEFSAAITLVGRCARALEAPDSC